MIKVTMNLTQRDDDNTAVIRRVTDARSKAQAVSTALSLTRFLIDRLRTKKGTEILLRDPDGTVERVVMPELEYASGTKQDGPELVSAG